jgi:hypothetical protein
MIHAGIHELVVLFNTFCIFEPNLVHLLFWQVWGCDGGTTGGIIRSTLFLGSE